MSISLLLEMAASSNPDRTAIVSKGASGSMRLTTQQLSDLADGGAGVIAGSNAKHVAYVGAGGAMLPVLIFAAARAGLPFTPINYRLSADGIAALIERLPDPLVIVDGRYRDSLGGVSPRLMTTDEFLAAARGAEPAAEGPGISRPGLGRDRAVHVGHHVATQGRRTLAQQPDQLCDRHGGIRVGRRKRRRADLRAAVSHRRGRCRAVEPVRRAQDGLPAQLRCVGMDSADQRRERDHRDGGAHHAGPDRHRARGRWCRAAVAAQLGLWRLEGRPAAGAPGARTVAGDRLRQRLRPDRDQFDDRGVDPG